MGQEEDAQPLVRRTNLCRAEQARRRRVAHAPKLSQDGLKAEGDVTRDVLEEHPLGLALPDNPGDVGPEVAGIIGPGAFASGAERLARVSGEDDVEGPAKGASIEAAEVVPDRGWGEVICTLGSDEDRSWPVLPFDEGAGVKTGFGKHEAQIQASAACAERQSVPGT